MEFNVSKADLEKREIFGWAMVSIDKDGNYVVDSQGDSIDPDELEKAVYKYVRFHGDMGQDHNQSGNGTLIESFVSTLDKQQAMGIPLGAIPVGWWVGFYVEDDNTWELLKNGDLKCFSIEGKSERVAV